MGQGEAKTAVVGLSPEQGAPPEPSIVWDFLTDYELEGEQILVLANSAGLQAILDVFRRLASAECEQYVLSDLPNSCFRKPIRLVVSWIPEPKEKSQPLIIRWIGGLFSRVARESLIRQDYSDGTMCFHWRLYREGWRECVGKIAALASPPLNDGSWQDLFCGASDAAVVVEYRENPTGQARVHGGKPDRE